jgi:tetratricopeptide (TPR) repeat protein
MLGMALAPWGLLQARRLDKSEDHLLREYGLALLAAAEGPAVLFTFGDNAWMPIAYLQVVEGARPDVRLVAAGLLRHPWYRAQLRARFPELELSEDAPGVAGMARANLGRANLYHADPRTQDLRGFQEVPGGLLMRLVPEGERALPLAPPAFALSPRYAVLDKRERSIRADMVQAYARTARWCRASGFPREAEQAAQQGLALSLPEPRLAEFHLARADLLLELGDLCASLGRLEEARSDWQRVLAEADPSPPAEVARARLASFGADPK